MKVPKKKLKNLDASIEVLTFFKEESDHKRWGDMIHIGFYTEKQITPDYIKERLHDKVKGNFKNDFKSAPSRAIVYHTLDFSIPHSVIYDIHNKVFEVKECYANLIYVCIGLISSEKILQEEGKKEIINQKLKTEMEQKALKGFDTDKLRIFKEMESENFKETGEKLRYYNLVWFNLSFDMTPYIEYLLSEIEEQKLIFDEEALNKLKDKAEMNINNYKRRVGEYICDEFIYLTHKEGVRRGNLCREYDVANMIYDLGIPRRCES